MEEEDHPFQEVLVSCPDHFLGEVDPVEVHSFVAYQSHQLGRMGLVAVVVLVVDPGNHHVHQKQEEENV